MPEQTVIARKDYICDHCGRPIEKGEKYEFGSTRIPEYDMEDMKEGIERQIGIKYVSWRLCLRLDCPDIDLDIDGKGIIPKP